MGAGFLAAAGECAERQRFERFARKRLLFVPVELWLPLRLMTAMSDARRNVLRRSSDPGRLVPAMCRPRSFLPSPTSIVRREVSETHYILAESFICADLLTHCLNKGDFDRRCHCVRCMCTFLPSTRSQVYCIIYIRGFGEKLCVRS